MTHLRPHAMIGLLSSGQLMSAEPRMDGFSRRIKKAQKMTKKQEKTQKNSKKTTKSSHGCETRHNKQRWDNLVQPILSKKMATGLIFVPENLGQKSSFFAFFGKNRQNA